MKLKSFRPFAAALTYRSAIVPALAFSAFSATQTFAQTWNGTLGNTGESWNVDTNWTPSPFPNAVGATANLTVDWTANKTISLQQAVTVGTLNFDDTGLGTDNSITLNTGTAGALNFAVTTGSAALTAAVGTSSVTHAISAPMTLSNNLDVTTNVNANLNLTGVISGSGSMTKTATAGTITLSANNTGWSGGIIHRQGTFTLGGTANAVLGTGTFTWSNPATAGLNNTLALNANTSRTFANSFVNNNAFPITSTQYAQFSFFGSVSNYRTVTFSGSFSTGPDFVTTQSLFLGANGLVTGLAEGALIMSGNWANYLGGANSNAIRIADGSVVINAQQAVAGSGGYNFAGNNIAVASKLILNGAFTLPNEVRAQSLSNGMRNSFGSNNLTATTAVHSGIFQNLEVIDGANVFSQIAGATLDLQNVQGTGNTRINDSYTRTTADATNSLQAPTGTVLLSRATGNTATGGFTVIKGSLVVTNTTGSGTGTGPVVVGGVGAATSGQLGSIVNTGTGTLNTRVIGGVITATALTLQIGQRITGTGIPTESVLTGITIGNDVANSTLVIDKTISVPASTTTSFTDIATIAATTAGTLGGTGRIAPTLTNGLLVNAGSSINTVDGAATDFDIDLAGTGDATFAPGAKFVLEIGAQGVSDSVDFAGMADSNVVFNGNVVDLVGLSGVATGTYTIMNFSGSGEYVTSPAPLVIGALSGGISSATLNYSDPLAIKVDIVVAAAGADYNTWVTGFGLENPFVTVGNPALNGMPGADPDNDGLTNQQEYAFGLIPNSGASVNPIVVPLNKATGRFSYTRRTLGLPDPDLAYNVQTSTNLTAWAPDATATQTVTSTVGQVQTVEVQLSGTPPLTAPVLFVRVIAQ